MRKEYTVGTELRPNQLKHCMIIDFELFHGAFEEGVWFAVKDAVIHKEQGMLNACFNEPSVSGSGVRNFDKKYCWHIIQGAKDSRNYIFKGWYEDPMISIDISKINLSKFEGKKEVKPIMKIETSDGTIYTPNSINGMHILQMQDLVSAYTKQLATWKNFDKQGWNF